MAIKRLSVLGARISALTWDDAVTQILVWGAGNESRYVSMCNVHSVITTTQDQQFRSVINNADLALADGAPIAWAVRKLGYARQERINGPDLMWRYLAEAEQLEQIVFFFGSSDTTLQKLSAAIESRFPKLKIGGTYSPSFSKASIEEDECHVTTINRSGAHVVFVGLGCPKQEIWMAAHRGRINAVMVGVGAAFDFHAGTIKRAPLWWQRNGLEWLYRLCSEPRRLFRRYLVTNTLFLLGICRQLIGIAISGK
jgi:N-acetylglucosaminyldiphosphoundecaprenol N-acetyl-beta-D-mannosaminyltransferase